MTEIDSPPPKKTSTGKVVALVGCGCLSLILIGAVAMGAIFFGVMKTMKGSEPFQESFAAVQASPAAVAALGEPIKPAFMVVGNIAYENGAGSVDMSYGVSGSIGEGNVVVVGEKPPGASNWEYSVRELRVEGQSEAIPLRP